jgi:hypothetical protein
MFGFGFGLAPVINQMKRQEFGFSFGLAPAINQLKRGFNYK